MKLGLVLTNDWELFGDGSGDYFDVQHNPSLNMLDLLNEYDAKMTLFAEVGQQWGFQSLIGQHESAEKIVNDWENLIRKYYTSGHDVQLHIHPQWTDGSYINNQWQLNDKNWSIGKLKADEKYSLLKRGKEYLEQVVSQVDNEYKCNIFRAGAYYIEPSSEVISSLDKLGFLADTSVTKGKIVSSEFDYTNAPDNLIPWRIKESVAIENNDGKIIELPIYSHFTLDSEVLRKFLPSLYFKWKFGKSPSHKEQEWAKERDRIKSIRYPIERRAYKKKEIRHFWWYVSKFISKNPIQLDYDYLPATAFVEIIKKILNNKKYEQYFKNGITLPVIASGHIKDAHNNDNLRWILEKIKNELSNEVEFWTMSQAVKQFKKIESITE